MTISVSACRFARAYEDEKAFNSLCRDIVGNLEKGAFTIGGCNHNPPCWKGRTLHGCVD